MEIIYVGENMGFPLLMTSLPQICYGSFSWSLSILNMDTFSPSDVGTMCTYIGW